MLALAVSPKNSSDVSDGPPAAQDQMDAIGVANDTDDQEPHEPENADIDLDDEDADMGFDDEEEENVQNMNASNILSSGCPTHPWMGQEAVLEDGQSVRVVDQPNVPTTFFGTFKEEVGSQLPYVEVVSKKSFNYSAVLMDEKRILGIKVRAKRSGISPVF